MIVYKCKMCGGDLEVTEGSKIATCEYCMTRQTIPTADDEKRAKLYNRANQFRRSGEFDRALGIYEQILAEDSEDAEVYWEIVLSKYGIQYVEDPTTKVQKPTVNRTLSNSILNDADYLKALELSNEVQEEIFEREANEIERIQNEIFFTVRNEKPYDIFISYKESASDGTRTGSSYIAESIYNQLTQEGYRVFFSRVSLINTAGQKYEPYIFSALRSAKVMLVIGTKKEEFEARWVRNEWSRFLTINRDQVDKALIVCFQDMRGDDLPEELRPLQGMEMSKMGFERELLRKVSQIVKAKQSQQLDSMDESIGENGTNGANARMVKRLIANASTFMSLDEYDKAFSTYQEITEKYPEEWQGWWGLIRAQTNGLQIMDAKNIIEQKSTLNGWFKNVRKLATEDQLEEPLNLYRDFWRREATIITQADVEQVKGIMKKHEADKKTVQQDLEEAKQSRMSASRTSEQQKNNIHSNLEEKELEIGHLEESITKYKGITTIGWTLLLGPWAVLLLADIFVKDKGDLPDLVPVLIVFINIVGIILLMIAKRMEPIKYKKNSLESCLKSVSSLEQSLEKLEDSEKKAEQEYASLKNKLQKKVSVIQDKIDLCGQFLKVDQKAMEDFTYASLCGQFGEESTYDQALRELRNKVMAR